LITVASPARANPCVSPCNSEDHSALAFRRAFTGSRSQSGPLAGQTFRRVLALFFVFGCSIRSDYMRIKRIVKGIEMRESTPSQSRIRRSLRVVPQRSAHFFLEVTVIANPAPLCRGKQSPRCEGSLLRPCHRILKSLRGGLRRSNPLIGRVRRLYRPRTDTVWKRLSGRRVLTLPVRDNNPDQDRGDHHAGQDGPKYHHEGRHHHDPGQRA
jgi:hypothetical protein